MQKTAMQQHFDWDDSAKGYEEVYQYALDKKRN